MVSLSLKNDEIVKPEVYLGGDLTMMTNEGGQQCWPMSSDKYCAAAVANVEETLAKKGQKLPSKCVTPMGSGYYPGLDVTAELKADGIQWFQEVIGQLRWAIELGRVDILLEMSLLSHHLALPREGHLEQALHNMGYLKSHKKFQIMFDSSNPILSESLFTDYDWFDFY